MNYDNWTIAQGRQHLIDHRNEGTHCLLCHRPAKVYRRPINSSMALVLIELRNYYRRSPPFRYIHVPTIVEGLSYPDKIRAALRGDWPKLRWWGFIVEAPDTFLPPDGSKSRSGYWCITEYGLSFAEDQAVAYSHVYEYRGEILGWDTDLVSIKNCLKKKFHYQDLMKGAA